MGVTAASVLAMPSAWANWSGHISGARLWFESRRWDEESYTELQFKGCDSQSDDEVGVEINEDITAWPDTGYGVKHFENCFDGGTSTGTESGLPKGSYYFRIECIDWECTKQLQNMNVKSVYVDTSQAD
ncbi:hypothetical protein ACWCXK_37255 [Streptomyces sp. NPDC001739]